MTDPTISILKSIVTQRPLAISIAAGSDIVLNYDSGIIDDAEACGTDTNHTVVIIGYGTDEESGLGYWIVRNSWGTGWGESGYFKLL